MAKPPKGNDATQELTMDQLVKTLPPKLPPGGKNDVSLWGRLVVGAEEFDPKTGAAKQGVRWPIVLLLLGALAAAGVAVFVVVTSHDAAEPTAAPLVEPPKPEANVVETKALEAKAPETKPAAPATDAKPVESKLAEPKTDPAAETKAVEAAKPAVAAKPVVKKPVRRPVKKPVAKKKPLPKRR